MVTNFIVRRLRTSVGLIKSHYDTLGISPSATQVEVKAAYYKKSMELHPDRIKGNRENFEDVANAYKILSDPSMRKLYDRREGVINKTGGTRSNSGLNGPLRKTPVYDFDQWTRQHYGDVIKCKTPRKDGPRTDGGHDRENVTLALMCLILCAVFIGVLDTREVSKTKTER